MSAPAGETHRAGVRQTRHEAGPAPPITSATCAIHPGGQPLRRAGEVPGPTPGHPFRALSWTSAGSSMTLDASLTVTRPCSTASRTAGAAGLSSDSTLAAWATVLLLTRSSAAASPWVKELCKFAPFPFEAVRGPTTPRACGIRLNGRLLQFPARGNGNGQARLQEPLYGCFFRGVQGRRAPRGPLTRRPSRFPRPRVPRTEHALTNLAPAAASNPSTNARPTELPMKQHEPE